MFVIIVGGGKTGTHLAHQLIAENHAVRLIEVRPEAVERLKAELPADVVIAGDGSSPATLEQRGDRPRSGARSSHRRGRGQPGDHHPGAV